MSEVLQIAKALSQSSDVEIAQMAGIRTMPTSTFSDFFDFASALIKPQNIASAISGLTRQQILTLGELISGNSEVKDTKSLESLVALFLVSGAEKGKFQVYDCVATTFKQIVSPTLLQELAQEPTSNFQTMETDFKLSDALAGISAFETIQALTEIVIELEQNYVREVGRGQVGIPELRRISAHLGRDVDHVRLLYALAQMASLIGVSDKRWKVGSQYLVWLGNSPSQRWRHLANTWLSLIEKSSALELSSVRNLREAVAETFPLANKGQLSNMDKVVKLAELIGITSSDLSTSWFSNLLKGDLQGATDLLEVNLPKTQNRIIIQADLSIIAVGPLPTDKELELRRFVETERIGIASTYRLSTLSITFGLETGLTEQEIRTLLTELSGTALPQPVDYLIREAASRFGRLVLREIENGTAIESNELILLTQILNDSALRTISITRRDEVSLTSRFELDIVYYLLRESNYAAIRKNSKGQVVSSWNAAGSNPNSLMATSSVFEDVQRLRDHDKRLGEKPEGQDLVRQIEMAIKTKATISISLQMHGTSRDFSIEPTGLANGRLRGKDRQADCERVLPLSSITAVRLG
jgi:hypothetical protein